MRIGTLARTAAGINIKPKRNVWKRIKRHWQLYLVVLLPLTYIIIFKYIPMLGTAIAFKDYNVIKGIWGSPWAGMTYFNQFFESPNFWLYIKNTIGISLYGIAVGFPAPIILAIALNEIRNGPFKKTVQMATYAPYFISTVIMVSIIMMSLLPEVGLISKFLGMLGVANTNFMGIPKLFKTIYVMSDVWQYSGYSAVIYIAALAGVNPELYESAKVDGASRLQKIINVDIPSLIPVSVILLILSVGNIMKVGVEKIFLMQNMLNLSSSEVISTYVYKVGLLNASYSFSAAIGLFNSLVNLLLLVLVNQVAKKISGSSLW
ncbi:ABC transporter permease [Paenibacillus sp. GCM10027628]|uniref:ABC transporter permease n=1 Tax=Paenibacillus sp. GCM10027628 TaxID=3273413 RepID=UPI00363417F3